MKLGPWKPEPDLQARSPYPFCLRLRLGNHGKAVVGQAYSASSIGATAHWADRLFRLTSALTKLPPLAVVRASPKSEIWTLAPKRRKGGIDSHAHRGAVVTAPAHRTRQECRPVMKTYLPRLFSNSIRLFIEPASNHPEIAEDGLYSRAASPQYALVRRPAFRLHPAQGRILPSYLPVDV